VKAGASLCIADQLINITIFNDIRSIYRIASKISSTLPWSAVNLIPKFHENPVNSPTIFWVIVFTNSQAERQTDKRRSKQKPRQKWRR